MDDKQHAEMITICTELSELSRAGTLTRARYMELARRAEELVGDDYQEMEPILLFAEEDWDRELGYNV
jgi:hypothetical protein